MFIRFDQIFVCLYICGPRIFEITPSDATHLSYIFDKLSLPVIMSNLNKFGYFTLGEGGDLLHLATPNTRIFIFILYCCESQLDTVHFEPPTHSPRMVN